jgi:hypothetical protein
MEQPAGKKGDKKKRQITKSSTDKIKRGERIRKLLA